MIERVFAALLVCSCSTSGTAVNGGIEYVHVGAAGNPYRNLRDDPERCLALYAEHLDEHLAVLVEIEEALSGSRSALLCMEASHERCHRSVIAARLTRRAVRGAVTHL